MTSSNRALERWHWRTWDLLRQIERATDGESPEQRSGVAAGPGLGVAAGSEINAFKRRGFIECADSAEIVGRDGYGLIDSKGAAVVRPIWVITPAGRAALHSELGAKAKRDAGIVIHPAASTS